MNNMVANPFAAERKQAGSSALAQSDEARSVSEVQSMMVIAKKFPRDPIKATDTILQRCTRPTLAECALYSYARGGSEITGPSIRLAETIAQAWGNFQFGFREISRSRGEDGVTFSDVEAYAWDLETNTRRPVSFRVRHWRDTKKGGYALTDERDIYELTSNMAQRRVRACILGVIPGDLVEAAVRQCEVTLASSGDTSPEAVKKMAEAFLAIGVSKGQIERRIQCRLEAIRPAQVVQLRKIYTSIKDEMSMPADWFEPDDAAAGGASKAAPAAATARKPLPAYPSAQFDASLPQWRDLIAAGKKTPDDIIAMVGSRYALTDDQIATIKADPYTGETDAPEKTAAPETDAWLDGYNGEKA